MASSGSRKGERGSMAGLVSAALAQGVQGEGCLAGVDLGHIKTNYPIAFWMSFKYMFLDPAALEKLKISLQAKKIYYPDWFAPFQTDRVSGESGASGCCLRLNHSKGEGCDKPQCNYKHVCIMCNSKSHGAFQKETVNGQTQYKCKLHLGLVKEFLGLRKQYKPDRRDKKESAAAFAIGLGVTDALITSIMVPLLVKLKRGIPAIVDKPTLKSLWVDVAALGVGAAFEERKKSAAAEAHKTKPKAKPATRPPSRDRAATPSTSTMPAAAGWAATAAKPAEEHHTRLQQPPDFSVEQRTGPPTPSPGPPSAAEESESGSGYHTLPTTALPTVTISPSRAEVLAVPVCIACIKQPSGTAGSPSTVRLPCGHQICNECYAKTTARKAVPGFNAGLLMLQVVKCPECSEFHLVNPDSELMLSLASFLSSCRAHPVMRTVSTAKHVLNELPQPPKSAGCHELHLADVLCETCDMHYCSKCNDSIHRVLAHVDGGKPHTFVKMNKIHDKVYGLTSRMAHEVPMCPTHRKLVSLVSSNDVSQALSTAATYAETCTRITGTTPPAVPDPLGCSDCVLHGRHSSHNIQPIESAATHARSILKQDVIDAGDHRRILDHIRDILKALAAPIELIDDVRQVWSQLERIGQTDGPRLLEMPPHRLALIGVAFELAHVNL